MKENEGMEGSMEIMETVQDEPYKSGSIQYIDSREVAEVVGKEHGKMLRDIRIYVEQLNQTNFGTVDFFMESAYVDAKGEKRPCYLVTRKGCEFIAHKLTGIKGTKFTATYINRFHEMEERIQSAPSGITEEMVVQIVEKAVERLAGRERPGMFGSVGMGISWASSSYRDMEREGIEIRKKELYAITAKAADLYGESHSGVLHQMYKLLEERFGIILDAYKSVYRSETGRHNAGMVEVIAANERIYEEAMDLTEYAIGKKQIYS